VISILIVDDEALARDKLRRLLARHLDVSVAGEAANGEEAVAGVAGLRPDLVFLDIDLPDRSGFQVIESFEPGRVPLVVFVTAYDEFAVRAFEVHAVDYLLKPFEEHRLDAALERVRTRLAGSGGESIEPLLAMLAEMRARQHELERRLLGNDFATRLAIRDGAETVFVAVDGIDWVESADNYVEVHAAGRTHLLRETLAAMESRLDPRHFTRIHRGTIVHDLRVRSLRPQATGELEAVLEDGTALPVGRSYRERVLAKWQQH
jgi:two-component system LytT family response regulator